MRESKAHGFVAWLFDFYIANFAIGAVAALTLAATDGTGDLRMALVILGLSLLASVVYHVGASARLRWLSPGERIAGRFVATDGKVWRNPYRRTRWPLFAIMLVVTILAGNTWDGIGRGAELSAGKVLLDAIALAILTVGMMAVGRGDAIGMLAPALYAALLSVTVLRSGSEEVSAVPREARVGLTLVYGALVLPCVLAGVAYRRFSIGDGS